MKKIFFFTLVMLGIMTGKSQIQVSYIDTFNFTGSPQLFVVPSGVDSVRIKAWGGEGGRGRVSVGGLGGYAQGVLKVATGDTLHLYVGGMGANHDVFGAVDTEAPGGWNGGGKGGFDRYPQVENGGAGGGASDVRIGGSQLSNRIMVAGAGGGGSGGFFGPAPGGAGGGLVGGAGTGLNNASGYGGGGGTQVSGGGAVTTSRGATHGSLGLGGNGSSNQDAWGAGGGGGGFYGGGGGTSIVDHGAGFAAGGGGGSSYIGGVSDSSTTSGVRSGNGMIVLEYTKITCANVTVNSTTAPSSGQSNGSIDLNVNGGDIRFCRWSKKEGVNYPAGTDYDLTNAPAGSYYLMLITTSNKICYKGPYTLGTP